MPRIETKPIQLDIEQLKQEHARLDRAKTTAEANLKNATDQLEVLRDEAKATYGTDDLDELRKKLTQMQADNEAKRAEYQKHLEKIRHDLQQVEQTFGKRE
jgi:hypothetical protein